MDRQDSKTTLYSQIATEKEYLELLEAAVEQSEIGYLIADKDCNVIKVNLAQIRITGQEPSVNLGRNMREVQITDQSLSATVMVAETGKPVKIEQHLINGNSYLVYGTPYFDNNGKLKYIINNLIDTTEINKTKAQLHHIQTTNERLSVKLRELEHRVSLESKIIYQSRAIHNMLLLCDKIAKFDATILIMGESGVGKELVAEYIYENSQRYRKSFLKINCASIPENLLESELFGYEAGAFTGAGSNGKKGLLEFAHEGTLLLDEIGELPITLQAKLLRFLQEGEFYHIGGRKPLHADVRILAATNRNLQEMVEQKSFREDLFYRLNVIPVRVPSLKERKEDIPLLVKHFEKQFNEKYGFEKKLTTDAIELLKNFPIRGNVRELKNNVERLLMLCDPDSIQASDVLLVLNEEERAVYAQEELGLKEMVQSFEKNLLLQFAQKYGTEQSMSRALKVSQSTISRKLSQYRISNIQK